ncbi:hypothetical protein GmHk_07G020469 [Glycine max]|nr:hypothetical protein GmHk_07G020469 [Glycine max]
MREMADEKLKGQKVKFFGVPEPSPTYPKAKAFLLGQKVKFFGVPEPSPTYRKAEAFLLGLADKRLNFLVFLSLLRHKVVTESKLCSAFEGQGKASFFSLLR